MYILSAVAQPKLIWNMVEYIVLNVLDGSVGIMFDCCIYGQKHEKAYRTMAHIKHKYTVDKRNVRMFATQYYCSCQDINFKPLYIILVERHAICTHRAQMKTVIYPEMKENSTAICTKVAFNNLNPLHLIEWFEYQKLMGVATVLIMLQTLNSDAYAVFKHYEREGIVQLLSFPDVLPGCIDRGFEKNRWHMFQSVHDEQLAVFTCEQLLQGFAFVAVIDFDEYIIHNKFMTYSEFMKSELLPSHPDAAGFVLNVSFFITDWGVSGTGNMLTTKYIRRTNPRYERYKNIYIPRRTKTLDTHTIHPKKGYKRIVLTSHSVVLHHYRKCPSSLQWKFCLRYTKTLDFKMFKIMPVLYYHVDLAMKEIGIINHTDNMFRKTRI
ncbi:unnamed protein product [Mytilus coruscus]|uniref:Glycosyltransferase family 92 protein n=1 Tax=Mytilus coruscus TaxID=42192 RepID=A0A6J8BV99_MYTCO|nr:unnamed protein product [Mytilus coruscus]